MARIRSVHPGLFTDEAFIMLTVDLPIGIPLLIGLWCEADDFGAFAWKPITIKARVLPGTSVDVGELLAKLEALDFIRSFTFGGRRIGVIRNFGRFQRPKKPTALHPCDEESRLYAGFGASISGDAHADHDEETLGSEPVLHQYGTGAEIPPRREGEEEGEKIDPPPPGAGASDVSNPRELERTCRRLMSGKPAAIDVNFGPILKLLDEGITGDDVISGIEQALAKGFQPKFWGRFEKWVRNAAADRLAARVVKLDEARRPRAGPAPPKRRSHVSVSLEILRGNEPFARDASGLRTPNGAHPGPRLEGDLVAM